MSQTFHKFAEIDCRVLAKLLEAGFLANVVYDVGASNGAWTWNAAKLLKGAEFHLFEPQMESDANYAKNIANVKRYTKATLHPIALGERNGTAHLQLFSSSAAASMLKPGILSRIKSRLRGAPPRGTMKVPLFRLDDYARQKGLPAPDILKMDVQGYELEILKGAEEALQRSSLVLAECWLQRSYGPKTPLLHEAIAYFAARDFVLLDLGETFHAAHRRTTAVDAYFMRKDVAGRLFSGPGGALNWRL